MGHGFEVYFVIGMRGIEEIGGFRGLDKISAGWGFLMSALLNSGGQERPSCMALSWSPDWILVECMVEECRSFVGSRSRAAPLPQDDKLICYQSNLVGSSLGAQNGGLSLDGAP